MADWSASVPDKFEQDGFSYSKQNGVIRSDMDFGPAKVRRRFTAVTTIYSGTIVMTQSQFGEFETWFSSTIGYGSMPFTFPDPLGSSDITVRFITGDPPYNVSPDGSTTSLRVSFQLEKLP